MSIKPHCMGMPFPEDIDHCPKCSEYLHDEIGHSCPTAADLDAVAEEEKVKEKTSSNGRSQP